MKLLPRQIGLQRNAQYGWGHTIDFGPFCKEGLLQEAYLKIAGAFDEWAWWPSCLDGMRVADVGCFTGGLSLLVAHRGAEVVYAVDEIPEHLDQCSFLARTFGIDTIRPLLRSAYRLREDIAPGSLDMILLSGVLYHMSDMLVGLYAMRELLKPGGLLLLQSSGVDDFARSYANFGRFIAGRWWQPTGLCLQDMLHSRVIQTAWSGFISRTIVLPALPERRSTSHSNAGSIGSLMTSTIPGRAR